METEGQYQCGSVVSSEYPKAQFYLHSSSRVGLPRSNIFCLPLVPVIVPFTLSRNPVFFCPGFYFLFCLV
jgi:hypothetical protein